MQRIIFCLVLSAANLFIASTRAQLVPPNVPLNNLIAERVYNLESPKLKDLSSGTNASVAAPFITDSAASLEFDYIYTREWDHTTTPGGGYMSPEWITKFNGYNIAPSIFINIRSNLLVTAGFDYLHESISENSGSGINYDAYTPFICADEELLHFLPRLDTARNSLFLGGNFSYTRFIGSDGASDLYKLGSNDYNFGPSLVYICSLVDWGDGTPGRASVTLNPAYMYFYDQTPAPLGLQRSANFTLLGRVDYGLTRKVYLNLSGTWVHNTYSALMIPDHDYAVFGGGLTAKLLNQSNHLVLFRLAYAYEAFLKQAEIHEVSAQLEFHF